MNRNYLRYLSIEFILIILACLVISGCSSKTTVVLLPNPDGKTGALTVSNSAGSVDIDSPNQATTISGMQSTPSTPVTLKKQEIDTLFYRALRAQPKPPIHFILYFISNSNELKTGSLKTLPTIVQAIKERNSVDISIIGHTDTVGSDEYNYTLSKNRAEAVAILLVKQGAQSDHIKTTSHGEENPLVKAGDNISEPKNRRVEVVVR
jgi:outer membrane protein OmpA-like peptidoglycan-associated protein